MRTVLLATKWTVYLWGILVAGVIFLAIGAVFGALFEFLQNNILLIILLASPVATLFVYSSYKKNQLALLEYEQNLSTEAKAQRQEAAEVAKVAAQAETQQKAKEELAKPSTIIVLVLVGLLIAWELIRLFLWITGLSFG